MSFEPETKKIRSVQFSIMSPEEIRERSVVEITKHDTYDKDVPVIKGLFDIRMGSTEMGKICGTCNQDNINCPGHFGHLELSRPVYHYHLMDIIPKILTCVCYNCSKLLLNKEDDIIKNILKKSHKIRFTEMYNLCQKIKRCGDENVDGCGYKQPDKYKIAAMEGIHATWTKLDIDDKNQNNIKKQLLQIEQVKMILEKITNEDCNYLGFSDLWCRPEWLICSVLPVPPPPVRPSVKQDNSQRMDDDLTHKLQDIIKTNNIVAIKIKNDKMEDIENWTQVLQYHIATFIDNELSSGVKPSTHRSGRPLKSIRQRLKGKEGRIRNNLMGKRVDFSARSVITPDPNIDLDELGVPDKIANNLTYPEKVNNININALNKLLQKGCNEWPNIKNILKKDNTKITINHNNYKDIVLENGDIVNRTLMDGDYVLFNRQPSLHKMSMMAHRVKVMKGNTFRLNISVTPPYNADFDGDEMNMHVPQSISSMCELRNLVSVNYQIISPRENKPLITIVQDTLLGINKFTKSEKIKPIEYNGYHYSENTNIYPIKESISENNEYLDDTTYLNKTQLMNIICNLSTYNGVLPEPSRTINIKGIDVPLWSGKDILSYILPNNLNVVINNNSYDNNTDDPFNDQLNKIVIENGKIKSGAFDKGTFIKCT